MSGYGGAAAQPVDRALENVGRRRFVDFGGALGARDVYCDQRPLHGGGRQSLIPQGDWEPGARSEIAGERPGGLGAGAFRTVHVARQADDEADGAPLGGELPEPFSLCAEFRPANRFDGRRNLPVRIATGDADRLFPEIQPEKRSSRRKGEARLFKFLAHWGRVARIAVRAPPARALPDGQVDMSAIALLTPLRASLSIIVVLALLAGSACSRAEVAPSDAQAQVILEARKGDRWRLEYALDQKTARLDLGPSLDGFRHDNWLVESPDLVLQQDGGRDYLAAADGSPFNRATLSIAPISNPQVKEYQPFAPMGVSGVLIYTGHIGPWRDEGARMDARFDVIVYEGGVIAAFDQASSTLTNWQSPYDHPAFIYIGPQQPIETDAVVAVIDDRAPEWVRAEFDATVPALFDYFAVAFGWTPEARPNFFLAAGDFFESGRISYRGDALPGQFQATLVGGVWLERSDKAESILRLTTAHEASHLWQLQVGSLNGAPNYIHEGGADALAAEAMTALGLWSDEAADAFLVKARDECAKLTRGRSLRSVETDFDWRPAYACGHVLTVAAAGGAGPAAFWRRLVERARLEGGYGEPLFLSVAEEFSGRKTSEAIAAFVTTNLAKPEAALDSLLVRPTSASAGLDAPPAD